MPNYYQVETTNMKVVASAFSPNIMLETVELDNRVLGTTYDPITGSFVGHKITLSMDKEYIMADGTEAVRVTATIKTWDDQEAGSEFTAPIKFIVDGVPKFITKKTDGYYTDFKTTVPGTKTITTQDEKFISQGSVSILAFEVE
jgi:hypothetical protein